MGETIILKLILMVLLSYFLGSIAGAYYVTKTLIGKDIRELGSGNAGARNAGRQLGKKGFFYTLLIDVAKVMIALFITALLFPDNDIMLLVSSFFLLIGHIWPLHLECKGGKGVVVFLATTLYCLPQAIAVLAITIGIGYMLVRNFTIAGLLSMASIPITAWVLDKHEFAVGLSLLFIIMIIPHITRR